MKNIMMTILIFLSLTAFAQKDGSRGRMDSEAIKAAKIAFLTERLNLDTETAQAFWPLYNEYEAAKDEMNKNFMRELKDIGISSPRRDMNNITDEQATAMVKIMFQKRERDLKLEKEYVEQVSKVLSPKQTLTVSQFDAEFRRTLMRRYTEESRQRRRKSDGGN